MPITSTDQSLLSGIESRGRPLLDDLPVRQEKPPLDDSSIRRRALMHTVSRLDTIPNEPGRSLAESAFDTIKVMEDIIRISGDRALREEESLKELQSVSDSYARIAARPETPNPLRDASYQLLNRVYEEAAQKREDMATERRFVEAKQALLASGKRDEAFMLETMYHTPDALTWKAQRLADREYMRKALEEAMPEEKDRNLFFGFIDFYMLGIPLLETTSYSGNVDTPDVEKGIMDWLFPGQRLRNEAFAFDQIMQIRDPKARAAAMDQVAKNMAASANDFGYRNQMLEGFIRASIINQAPNADVTNFWAGLDLALAPFAVQDAISVARGTKAASTSAIKMLQRSGNRSAAADVAKDVAERIKTKGPGQAQTETGISLDDVEDAYLPSALNPNATPGEVSLAGALTDGPEDAEVIAKRLFGDNLRVDRLSEEEWAEAELKIKAQAKKDFGRHVHDVQLDDIKLASGGYVRSPVVTFGTTKDGLFVTRAEAEKQMANLGLSSAVVKEIPSEAGVLYGIEARLPISESQFYRVIDDTKPKNFLWRFLLGSRQTSSDQLYGLSELVGAKEQRIVTALENEVNPVFQKLNNSDKRILLDLLVKSEKDQKWFTGKELDILWARQAGIGDDVVEITDTEIRVGNINAVGGDPEFLSQKAFLDLKDRSAALGKEIDELVKNSGAADEATFWETASDADKAKMEELTAVNAQIAKGPQPVTIDAFLEPHTYKEWRAKSATPPPAKGMIRMYHGGVPGEGGRWATDSLEDARGWASRGDGMVIQYVDIPADDVRRFAPGEGAAEGFAPNGRFELTAEEMKRARVFKEGDTLFPPEHEDLWKALDAAADAALAQQTKVGEQALRSTRRAADLAVVDEMRQATPHLDDFVETFRGGVFMNEVSGINGMPSTPLYGFTGRDDLLNLAEQVVAMDPRNVNRTEGIRMLELPGNRYVAWPGHLAYHDNVFMQLNDMLVERGLPQLDIADVASIYVPVDPTKSGTKRFGKVEIDRLEETPVPFSPDDIEARMKNLGNILRGEPEAPKKPNKTTMSYADFARNLEAYKVSGKAFTKRIKDAERRANTAMQDAMTGGTVTEMFRESVDKAMSLFDTKYLKNANGQVLHTNRQKIMTRPLEWSEGIAGLMPDKLRRAYFKMVEISNLDHLMRNDDAYMTKAVRNFSTVTLRRGGEPFIEDIDGIVYRAGSIPPVPSSRVYNISDDIHYVAKTEDDVKQGQALRLTSADINRMMKKEGYIMVRLEQPVEVGNRVTAQWIIGKVSDFEVKPLKFNQIGYRAGGHRGYVDKHFAKQVSIGTQGDNGEIYLQNPHTFMVGTEAEVKAWVQTMEQARIIWNNSDDATRRMENLSNLLDGKPGFPSAEEFALMIKNKQFDPEYKVEAVFDREQPSDYAKLRTRGWDDMSDPEESGINTYMQTHGRMYTSPKGERLPDWRGQDAQIIDPYEMMNKALNNIASLSSLSDFKMRAIEKWVKTFGPYLDLRGLPRDASPVRIFQESVFLNDLPEAQKIKNSAEAQRDTIKRVLGWRSDVDREFEYMGRQLVSFVAGEKPGKWNKSMSRGLQWAMEKDPVARARKMAFHMYLGLGNLPQFLTQISTMLAVGSLDVRRGLQAYSGIIPLRGAFGLTGKAADDWVDFWVKSGWHKVAGFDNEADFRDMMKAGRNSGWLDIGGSHTLINYQGVSADLGVLGKGVTGEALDAAGKAGKAVLKIGAVPFNEAEMWNRMVGWQLGWKDAKKAGLIPGTSKFNEFVLTKANDYTFNMTRAGQAAWQRGIASIPTQFLSFQARVLEAMLGKQFTPAQKIRLVLGQTILYGTAGPPLLGFAIDLFDGEKGEAGKIGTWQGLVERGIVDTIVSAATGMDISYSQRVATGGFISDTFRELFGMSRYGEVSFADIMGGPLWSLTKDSADAGTKLFWNVVRMVSAESGGDTGLEMTADSVTQMARNVASFNTAYKAYMVWNYGQFVTKSNKVVLDDLPSEMAFAVLLGLTPGEYADYVVKQDWRKNRQQVVRDLSDKILEYRQRLAREVDNSEAVISQLEVLRGTTPPDIWADALDQAQRSKAGESIYDGLARRYEKDRNQQRIAEEQ